jgi:hypothetical protein
MEKLKVNINNFSLILLRFLTGVTKSGMEYAFPDICTLRTNMLIFFFLLVLFPIPTLIISTTLKLIANDGKEGKIIAYIIVTLLMYVIGMIVLYRIGRLTTIVFFDMYILIPTVGAIVLALFLGLLVVIFTIGEVIESRYKNGFKPDKIHKKSIFTVMYESWKNKYCVPIEYVNKTRKHES